MATIRRAAVEDAPDIARLIVELGYEATVEQTEQGLRELDASGEQAVFVAVEDDATVGLLALQAVAMLHLAGASRRLARINTLVVTKAARRCGIGARLIDHAVVEARALGCAGIELTTRVDRAEAQAFYAVQGFEQTSVRLYRRL